VRRILAIVVVTAAAVGLLAFGTAAGGDGATYQVRAIFANGGFLVPGEEIRIAGAKVGSVGEVDVTGADEAAHDNGSPEPGSAVVVLDIDDPGFQDFREDASCIIRPQGLLGERFVECKATEPRAAGTAAPPPLQTIPDGEPGAGQYLLPLEQNGKAVDLDLVNNIMKEPYPDRFRLILNDLGAGVAARGEDLEQLIYRANPALQQTDRVLAILAKQNRDLARLARDSDNALGPLAGEREHIRGFINNANVAAEATAERRGDLEASLQKLPGFLVELRSTMTELDRFATNSTPVVADLGDAAPSLTRINAALGPFSHAGRKSLRSLGRAAEQAGPSLKDADPILVRIREVAEASGPLGRTLANLLASLRRNDAYENLTGFLFNAAGATNAYDTFGHMARLVIPLNNCVDYRPNPESSCESFFTSTSKSSPPPKTRPQSRELKRMLDGGKIDAAGRDEPPLPGLDAFDGDVEPDQPAPGETAPGEPAPEEDPSTQSAPADPQATKVLFDYLMGDGASGGHTADKAGRR